MSETRRVFQVTKPSVLGTECDHVEADWYEVPIGGELDFYVNVDPDRVDVRKVRTYARAMWKDVRDEGSAKEYYERRIG